MGQIVVALQSKFSEDKAELARAQEDKALIWDDQEFFAALRHQYHRKMCSVWRRCVSLKIFRQIRLLSVCIDNGVGADDSVR